MPPITLNYTDLTRWRLKVEDGRQTWHYVSEEEAKAWPQTAVDKYWLDLELVCLTDDKARKHIKINKLL